MDTGKAIMQNGKGNHYAGIWYIPRYMVEVLPFGEKDLSRSCQNNVQGFKVQDKTTLPASRISINRLAFCDSPDLLVLAQITARPGISHRVLAP